MDRFLATFYTHHGAMVTKKALSNNNIECKIMPPPRAVSSSCTSCVLYNSESDKRELLDSDFEALYKVEKNDKFTLLCEN